MSWFNHSLEHSLARKGIKSKKYRMIKHLWIKPKAILKTKINGWNIRDLKKYEVSDKLFRAYKNDKDIYIRNTLDGYKLYYSDKYTNETLINKSENYNKLKKEALNLIKEKLI